MYFIFVISERGFGIILTSTVNYLNWRNSKYKINLGMSNDLDISNTMT